MSDCPYQVKTLKLGVEIRGLDLNKYVDPDVIKQIKSDVTQHLLVVFKNQGVVTGERQVEISKWFGELDDVIIKHPKQVHPSVFRISNDASEGVTGAGRGGWHVDGNYHESPNAFSIYHIVSTSSTGDTVFAPLTKLLENLPQEQYDRWDRLWMKSSKKPGYIHPLIYTYPISHKKVMCFNLAWTESFIWDYGTSQERQTENNETKAILKEIEHEFVKDNGAIQYSHKWEPGDFMVTDNPALGHIASPGTQDTPENVGLRILHRTTIKGLKRPSK